jgi:dTDP-glucose 4,6-dehydratase
MLGTKLLLELALKKRSISFLYISSVSVYGHSQSKALKKETDFSGIDCMDIRNSYIESKRMGEMTCVAYYTQYGVPVTCIRPATVLVPEFYSGEKGHVTEFARTMADKKNIILNSNGLSFRTYIPICDTIEAVFMTLLKGLRGKAYNIAHRTYVFSMLEMAELFIRVSGNNYNKIIIADQVQDSKLREHHFCIDGMNLELLGWQPISNIEKAIHNMIEVIKHE